MWLLPGCESNHTSSSPPSLIYGVKKRSGTFEEVREEKKNPDGIEKSTFPASALSPLIANIRQKDKMHQHPSLATMTRLFVFSLENSVKDCIIVCSQQRRGGWKTVKTFQKCYTLPNFSITFRRERIFFPHQNTIYFVFEINILYTSKVITKMIMCINSIWIYYHYQMRRRYHRDGRYY